MNFLEYELMDSKKPFTFNLQIQKILDMKEIFQEYYQQKQNLTLEVSLILQKEKFPTNCIKTKYCKLQKITKWDQDSSFEFDKLTYESKLSFSLILNKHLSQPKYLAHCTYNLFDNNLTLKTGNQLLIFWPFVNPNYQQQDYAPAEIDEPFLDKIKTNYFAQKIKNPQLNQFHQNKNLEACINQSFFYNQSLPLVFLDINIELEGIQAKLILLDHPKISTIEKEQHVIMEVKQNHPQYIENNIYNYLYRKNTQNSQYLQVRDHLYDYDNEDPIMQMYLVNFDDEDVSDLKPNQQEKEMLEELISRPNFYHFSPEEKAEFWKFRYHLKGISAALPKFLISVNWSINKNIEIALQFIQDWVQLDYDDALFLLSKKFSANEIFPTDLLIQPDKKPIVLKAIRDHGVKSIQKEKTDKIEFLILQLVSSLRYEVLNINESNLVQFLINTLSFDKKLISKFYWNVNVENDNENEIISQWYKEIQGSFCEKVRLSKNRDVFNHLMNHITIRDIFSQAFQNAITNSKKVENCAINIREYLLKKKMNEMKESLQGDFFFFKQDEIISKFQPEETKVFNSNTKPIRLTFQKKEEGSLRIMYKFSDDMRMDQLIMQIFSLMEFLLKALSVDLRLTLYEILVYSGEDGIMKFVDESNTVQNILEDNNDDLIKYLIKRSRDKTEKLKDNPIMVETPTLKEQPLKNVRKDIFDNYMESNASYSVITYLLGIGDRHLENLLITDDGKLFHIDFGYTMNEDPKLYPPPVKLNKQMIGVFAEKMLKLFQIQCIQ